MAFRVVPVLDLQSGQAVHAVGGRRADYRPIQSNLRAGSDPVLLAEAMRARYGFEECYVADLDSIEGRAPSVSVYSKLQALGLKLWVDAGIRELGDLNRLIQAEVDTIIIGLETVDGPTLLSQIIEHVGPDRVLFSLDLRAGLPIFAPESNWPVSTPFELAVTAVEAGFRRALILDLARVGLGQGAGTISLLERLVEYDPHVEWSVGGGIGCAEDVHAFKRAGASAVLVGSALHDGRLDGIIGI